MWRRGITGGCRHRADGQASAAASHRAQHQQKSQRAGEGPHSHQPTPLGHRYGRPTTTTTTTNNCSFIIAGNPFGKGFDLVLGADLTYDFEDLPPLVETFGALSHPGTEILLAYGMRPAFLWRLASHSCTATSLSQPLLIIYLFTSTGKERAAIEPFLEEVHREWDVVLVPDDQLDDRDISFPTFTIGIMHLTKKKKQ
jgi:hypothetical protein